MPDQQHDNPYQSFGRPDYESVDPSFESGVPPAAPRIIGVLNMVFGAILGLCGLCQGIVMIGQAVSLPQWQQVMQAQQDQLQRQIDELEANLDAADEDEAARTEKQIDALQQQAEEMERVPNPVHMWGLSDTRIVAFYAGQSIVTLLLNLLMFISGVGLISYRYWARNLAVWTAGLKVANLFAVCTVMVVLVGPTMAQGMEDMMAKIAEEQQDANIPVDQVAEGVRTSISIWATVWLLLGSIYPLICLWQLNRPEVKHACRREQASSKY